LRTFMGDELREDDLRVAYRAQRRIELAIEL
jgi:hypothetical protein